MRTPFYGLCWLVIALLFSTQPMADPVRLDFYSTDSPPIWSETLPKNGLGGEILEAVAREANLTLGIDYLPLKRYENLKQGNRLGNPLYFIGQEFASVIPLLATQAGFCFYRPHHPEGKRLRSLTDMVGMTIGVIRGTVASKDEFAGYGVKIEENTSLEALFKKLKQGRIDVALVIDTTAYYYIDKLFPGESDDFQFNALAGGETPIAIMLDKNTPNAGELTVKIRQALQKIIEDGRYYRILTGYGYGKPDADSNWRQRIKQALDQYRLSPIVIHE